MSDTKISDSVAWQYREDARHNGFDDDAWFDCTRELFNTLSDIIGPREFASVALGGGAWREDEAGWPIQVRALYEHPQPAKPEDVRLRDELRERAEFEAWANGRDLTRTRVGEYVSCWVQNDWETWQAALAATGKRQVGDAESANDDWHLRGYAYASKQATTCAGCGKHKHTPLRIDAMGGYVCLTCIDQKLGTLLNEFGHQNEQVGEVQGSND